SVTLNKTSKNLLTFGFIFILFVSSMMSINQVFAADVNSTKTTNSTDVTNSTQLTNSTDVTNSTQLTNSTDVTNSTQLTNSTDVTNSTQLTNSTDVTNSTQLTNSTDVTNSTQLTNSTDVTNSTKTSIVLYDQLGVVDRVGITHISSHRIDLTTHDASYTTNLRNLTI